MLFFLCFILLIGKSIYYIKRIVLIQCVPNELGAATGQLIGDIRMVGGSADWEGRVEVLYSIDYPEDTPLASWGTVSR